MLLYIQKTCRRSNQHLIDIMYSASRHGSSKTWPICLRDQYEVERRTHSQSKRLKTSPSKRTWAATSTGPRQGFYLYEPSISQKRCQGIFCPKGPQDKGHRKMLRAIFYSKHIKTCMKNHVWKFFQNRYVGGNFCSRWPSPGNLDIRFESFLIMGPRNRVIRHRRIQLSRPNFHLKTAS